ncbi:hypothetical protein SprV_0401542500 [Sparganum proliferum]
MVDSGHRVDPNKAFRVIHEVRPNYPKRLGHLEEVGTCYTAWSSRPKAKRCDAGVTFATQEDIVGQLPCRLQGTNDRLMCLRLPFRGAKFATIVSVYIPSLTNDQQHRNGDRKQLRLLRQHILKLHHRIYKADQACGRRQNSV